MNRQKIRGAAKRVLLSDERAEQMGQLVDKLRENSCRTDTSKLVNFILGIFIEKYEASEFENIQREFFDKKSYLKMLIHNVSDEEIDTSIQKYLKQSSTGKRRGRKPKTSAVTLEPDEAKSS